SIPEAVRDDLTGKAWDVGVGAGAHGPDFLCPRPVQHCTTGVSITLCDASAEGDQSGARLSRLTVRPDTPLSIPRPAALQAGCPALRGGSPLRRHGRLALDGQA